MSLFLSLRLHVFASSWLCLFLSLRLQIFVTSYPCLFLSCSLYNFVSFYPVLFVSFCLSSLQPSPFIIIPKEFSPCFLFNFFPHFSLQPFQASIKAGLELELNLWLLSSRLSRSARCGSKPFLEQMSENREIFFFWKWDSIKNSFDERKIFFDLGFRSIFFFKISSFRRKMNENGVAAFFRQRYIYAFHLRPPLSRIRTQTPTFYSRSVHLYAIIPLR